MNKTGIIKSFTIEFRKSGWFMPLVCVFTLLGINLAYLFLGMTPKETSWEAALFSLPLINTLFLSIFMTILASRTFDMEHKAGMWNVLQTIQSKNSIFFGKIIFGFFWLLLFCILQAIALIFIFKYPGFVGDIPFVRIILAVLGELISGMVIYSIGALLSFMFSNQFASLSINLGGTLVGFFLMLVTAKPVTPWSILPALRVVNMTMQEVDGTVHYGWCPITPGYWTIAIIWLIAMLLVGALLFHRMEEGAFPMSNKSDIHSTSSHSNLPVEILKLRRSSVWIPFFIIPLVSAAIGTFNFMGNQGVLSFSWDALWTQHSLFLGVFFLSPLIGILCSLLWRMEHTGTNWNLILSLESPWKIIKDKLLVSSGMSALCVLWIGVLYIGCGLCIGLPSMPPAVFYECMLCAAISCVAISSAQIFLSLIIRSFAIPVGIALGGSAIGIALVVKGWIYALPYAMLQTGLKTTTLEWETNLGEFIVAAVFYAALFYLLSVLYLKRSDVKTNE